VCLSLNLLAHDDGERDSLRNVRYKLNLHRTSMHKNSIFLLSTTDLTEYTKEYYKIYCVLLPVYMAVKYEFCMLFRNKIPLAWKTAFSIF